MTKSMFIDTHSHLYLGELSDHIPEAIEHLVQNNYTHSIQIGTTLESSSQCIELAKMYPILRATVGIHPCEAQDLDVELIPETLTQIENLITAHTAYVVGYGEIGLDHYHLSHDPAEAEIQKTRQKEWFQAQAKLAQKYNLPIVIHTRNCPAETYTEIQKSGIKKFVIHCFSETTDFAESIFAMSETSMISFTGILTYPKSVQIQEVAIKSPLNRLMIETDAPYLIPEQMRGKTSYCEPAFSKYVYDTLCELRSESPADIEKQLWESSVNFFRL